MAAGVFGNATIGYALDPFMGNKPVISPLALNQMRPGIQAGMLNANIGQNYNVVEPNPARARLLATDGTPGVHALGNFMSWHTATGTWVDD